MTKKFFATKRGLAVLSALLLLTALCGVCFGSTPMPAGTLLNALMGREGFETQSFILYHVRLPRVLGGMLAGAGLSVAGAMLQGITGNSLASPNILGINAGAGFCMMLLLAFFPQAASLSPLLCFLGAFATAMLILFLSDRFVNARTGVLLAGIAVTAVFNAGITLLSLTDTDILISYRTFSVGGLDGIADLRSLFLPALMIVISSVLCLVLSTKADVLCLGDAAATALGLHAKRMRVLCLALAGACAAAVVSFAGLLGFIGLTVPHLARKLAGHTLRASLPVCILSGAILLTLADLFGRILLAPSELPVGAVTALIGAPFYVYLLMRRKTDASI